MAAIYSTRFLLGRYSNATDTYTVPAGKLAVVKFVAAQAFAEVGAYLALQISNVPGVYFVSRVANEGAFWEVRLVAYPGETVRAIVGGGDIAYHVSGYLFDGAGAAAAESVVRELEVAEQLPAIPGLGG